MDSSHNLSQVAYDFPLVRVASWIWLIVVVGCYPLLLTTIPHDQTVFSTIHHHYEASSAIIKSHKVLIMFCLCSFRDRGFTSRTGKQIRLLRGSNLCPFGPQSWGPTHRRTHTAYAQPQGQGSAPGRRGDVSVALD